MLLTHRHPTRPRRAVLAGFAVASLAVGQLVNVVAGVSSAAAGTSAPSVTFGTPSVSGFTSKLSYTLNRAPKQIVGVVCSLAPSGAVAASAACGSQTSSSSTSTTYSVTLSGLNARSYTYRATVKLTDGGSDTNSTTFTVRPVAATCTVTHYSVAFDANPHTATGSCTGFGGAAVPSGDLNLAGTTHLGAGTYPSDRWSFTDPTGNYTNSGGTITDAIGPAAANCSVTSYSATFDANPHTASGSCTGVGAAALPASDLVLTHTTHTGAGTYSTDTWTFADPTGDYTNPGGTITDSIGPASANCKVSSYGLTYDGNPHTATGSCTGVGATALPSSDLVLSHTTHTGAGTYSDTWTFTDPTGDYTNSGGAITDSISQAAATCTVTGYNTGYTGQAQTAAGTCSGIGGVALPAGDLDLSQTVHTHAGSYSDAWSFTDTSGNYIDSNSTVGDVINPAIAGCTVTGYNVSFDGSPHSATGSCTGVGGITLSNDLVLGSTAHTNVGTYSDTWSFQDPTGDYTNPGSTVTDVITSAGPVISFTSTAPTGAVVGATPYYTPTATSTPPVPGQSAALNIDPAAASVCSINPDGTLSFTAAGTCTIDANQAGAAQVQQSFAITTPQAVYPVINNYDDQGNLLQTAVTPPNSGVNSCPVQKFPDGGCAIMDLDGSVGYTFDASATTDPNPAPSHDSVSYHWQIFYPPLFGPGIEFEDSGIQGYRSPVLHIVAGSFPELASDSRTAGDPDWRAELTTTVNGVTSTSVWFRFIYDSAFGLDFSTDCLLSGQFAGFDCHVVAPQLLPPGNQSLYFTSTAPTNAVVGGTTYTPTTTSFSGQPVTLSIDNASSTVCALDPSATIVSFIGPGTCTIDASQAATGDGISGWLADQKNQTFQVGT